ncbi:MAG: CDP-alcohol phosphatidyltransferase family protein [Deltaproteobacteria bacterium]|nr:MAG: CDP-alcohol phosphatidyltransferase family protein [Deltaproteobacteria bacterium]
MSLLASSPRRRPRFSAVVLADGLHAGARVLGLSLAERARRVALRAGADRVRVVTEPGDRTALVNWVRAGDGGLLVVWAADHVVHTPLVEPLVEAGADRAIAVGPDGAFAGAAFAGTPAAAAELAASPDATAAAWQAGGAARVPHGPIARFPARTPAERRAAARALEQIVHKPQDGPVTRWLYRPISVPITRLLLHTPIKPNHVSAIVAALGAVGVWFVAHADYQSVVVGSAIVLVAAYLDGCDGEIARLKLESSRLGAWLDTVTDEATTVAYMAALGWHNYLRYGHPWIAGSIAVGLAGYAVTIYGIYYYLVVVHGSANSQDYVDRLRIVDGPDGAPRLAPAPGEALTGIWAVLPHLGRRDFVNWGALLFAAAHWTHVSYALMLAGGVVGAWKIGRDHVRLRRQLRELRERRARAAPAHG